jgi:hypothetical protein
MCILIAAPRNMPRSRDRSTVDGEWSVGRPEGPAGTQKRLRGRMSRGPEGPTAEI